MYEFLTSLELRYVGLARCNIYKIVTSRRLSNFSIVSHPSSLRTGVMWSNFLVFVKMRAAKFCISCNLWRLFFDIPAQTVEQENSLLSTNEFKIVCRAKTSKEPNLLFTIYKNLNIWILIIWHSIENKEELSVDKWSLNDMFESSIMAKSFTCGTGVSSTSTDTTSWH